jgi:hypothetical protein
MIISTITVAGYDEALLGLSLSYKADYQNMSQLAERLAHRQGGHNKFLESIIAWLDINAPRYWWSQFDTYRHATKQSESTMHTLKRRLLTQADFETRIKEEYLDYLNSLIETKAHIKQIKAALPEGFLQRRIVCTSYKTLQNIFHQRCTHRLDDWTQFASHLKSIPYHTLIIPGAK